MIVTIDAALGLAGKVAVVTEGTHGIGLATAAKLCDSGAHVVPTYYGSDFDVWRAEILLQDRPGSCMTARVHPDDEQTLDELLDRCFDRYGRIDDLVHVIEPWQVRAGPEAVGRAVDSLLVLSRRLAPFMNGGGRVVTSVCGPADDGARPDVGFDASSAAVARAVRDLAAETAPAGVTVNALAAPQLETGPHTSSRGIFNRPVGPVQAGKLTAPEAVADAAALLCTAEAGWITGQMITVDGGASLAPGGAIDPRQAA